MGSTSGPAPSASTVQSRRSARRRRNMPQITRPTERVKIDLGDQVFTLRYTLRAMKEAAEEFGGSISSIEVLKTIDERNLGKLIWYGLRADQPEMTVEQ